MYSPETILKHLKFGKVIEKLKRTKQFHDKNRIFKDLLFSVSIETVAETKYA